MDIHIALSQAEVNYLLCHLRDESDLREKLAHSELTYMHPAERLFEFSNAFTCSEGDARALLGIASEYCPKSVQKIITALKLAGVTAF